MGDKRVHNFLKSIYMKGNVIEQVEFKLPNSLQSNTLAIIPQGLSPQPPDQWYKRLIGISDFSPIQQGLFQQGISKAPSIPAGPIKCTPPISAGPIRYHPHFSRANQMHPQFQLGTVG